MKTIQQKLEAVEERIREVVDVHCGCNDYATSYPPPEVWLHHVLQAIYKGTDPLIDGDYQIGIDGQIIRYRNKWEETGVTWDFSQPLSAQPPEVLDFLHNILIPQE